MIKTLCENVYFENKFFANIIYDIESGNFTYLSDIIFLNFP